MKWSCLVLVGLLCTIVFHTTHAMSLKEYAEKPFGRVLMLRHALAPGFGDPSNFQLRDCSTQRILDEVGREQSRQIGNAFRKAGLRFEGVYSSQWCRCLETAKLINMGKVKEFKIGKEKILTISKPSLVKEYIFQKGYVAINGISLTVSNSTNSNFSVSLIPETIERTNLSEIKKGDYLNIEADQQTITIVETVKKIKN